MKNLVIILMIHVSISSNLQAFTVENAITQQIHANCMYVNNLATSVPIKPGKRATMKCISNNKIGSLRVRTRGIQPASIDLVGYSSQEIDADDLVFKVTREGSQGAGRIEKLKIEVSQKEAKEKLQDADELPTLKALGGPSATELKVVGAGVAS